jgi:hypothetical protein
MSTFEDIIQEVLLNLEGYTGDQDVYGTLVEAVTETDKTLLVEGAIFPDGTGFTPGLIELGDELINVRSITEPTVASEDPTVAEFKNAIRGWRTSPASSHDVGTLVRNNPRFTRAAVKRAINDTIVALHPRVSVIRTYEFTYQGARVRYDMPEDARQVLQVQYFMPGASRSWESCKRWAFDLTGGSTSETGRALDVWDAFPGRKVQVVYQAEAAPLVNLTDNYATTTGLFEWTRDIIVLGACYRLTAFLDSQKSTVTTAEQSLVNSRSVYGNASYTAGTNLSKYFYSLYQARLQEATDRLQDMYPVAVHRIH